VGLLLTVAAQGLSAAPTTPAADAWRRQVEADWLRQDALRAAPGGQVTTREDAAGGCDGVKNGKFGFHTDMVADPWWQVDLGKSRPIRRVAVYNRCDLADRAARLSLLVSADGRAWREVYRHDGTVFYGATDGKPLVVRLSDVEGRYLRVQQPGTNYLHLDEVEVYEATEGGPNIALGRPADQCGVSQWSVRKVLALGPGGTHYPYGQALARARGLLRELAAGGVAAKAFRGELEALESRVRALGPTSSEGARRSLYLSCRWAARRIALSSPLLNFDRLLFVKRVPGTYSHMSDQNYGWWSRPGGGVFVLEGLRGAAPRTRCLTGSLPAGSFLSPDLSPDGKRVVFAYCRYYPWVSQAPDKVDKAKLPEDSFYHVYETRVDGTGLRQLTRGRQDDFDPRYLPNGKLAFLSTRRGQVLQYDATMSLASGGTVSWDSYVRCGGGPWRPVAIYTLHVMDADGANVHALSPFESFEWTPSVAADGRLLYARWDYVDRTNMPYMSLWSTNPDGTNPRIVYGNFTTNPHAIFEARCVPGSRKLLFTASAHHSITGGSLALLDPAIGTEGPEPITRLTPEVCFPETEGWPSTYFANPYPLSERLALTAWSNLPLLSEGSANPPNALGLYLWDAYGGLELLHRDPGISSMYPLPLRPRPDLPVHSSGVFAKKPTDKPETAGPEGRFLLLDVYQGLTGVQRGEVARLRVVAVPPKTQPTMNSPLLGATGDDPGKCVLGTVPVEADGSAQFRVPAGTAVFLQALSKDGLALQTMRSATYVQRKQVAGCVGCHEPRNLCPPNVRAIAASRPPSRLTPGPEGSWPLRFDRLVQPALNRQCVSCHSPASTDKAAARFDLSDARAYESLVTYGSPSLREQVLAAYRLGASQVGQGIASESRLLKLLRAPGGHYGVTLDADSLERLTTWMDTYAQYQGSFSEEQEEHLRQLRVRWADLLEPRSAVANGGSPGGQAAFGAMAKTAAVPGRVP
jgi:hypothetical protein